MAREKDDMKTLVVSQGKRIDALETTVGSLSDRITALAIGGTAEGMSKSDPPSTTPSPQPTVAPLSKGEIQQLIDITVDAAKKELCDRIKKLDDRVSQLEKELADKRRLANTHPSQKADGEQKPKNDPKLVTTPKQEQMPMPDTKKPQSSGGNYERDKVSYESPVIVYDAEYPSNDCIVPLRNTVKPLAELFEAQTGVYAALVSAFEFEVYFPLGWDEHQKKDWLKCHRYAEQMPAPPLVNGEPKYTYGTLVNVRREDHETLTEEEAQAFARRKPISRVIIKNGVRYTSRSFIDIDVLFPIGWTTPQIESWLKEVGCVENVPKGTESPPKKVVEVKPEKKPQMPPKATEQPKEGYKPPQPKKIEDEPPMVGGNEWLPIWILFGSIILILLAISLWSQVKTIVLCLGVFTFASGCIYALYKRFVWVIYGGTSKAIFDWMYDNSNKCLWWLGFTAIIATQIIAYPLFFP